MSMTEPKLKRRDNRRPAFGSNFSSVDQRREAKSEKGGDGDARQRFHGRTTESTHETDWNKMDAIVHNRWCRLAKKREKGRTDGEAHATNIMTASRNHAN